MEQKSIRSEIEHKEFPRAQDGYDREAVDRHLRAVAELLDRRAEGDASWRLSVAMADEVRRIGESAGTRVQEIVAVAEQSAQEIVERAESQASAIVEQAQAQANASAEAAEESADTIRRRALEDAARMRDEVEHEAQEARDRTHAQTDELRQAMATASTLLERLGSAGALAGELDAVSEPISGAPAQVDQGDAGEDRRQPRPPRTSYRDAGPATEPDTAAATEESNARPASVWFSKLGRKRNAPTDEAASSNGGPESVVREAVATEERSDPEAELPELVDAPRAAVVPEAGEPVGEPEEEDSDEQPVADEITSVEAPGRQSLETYTAHKMRMAAFNMLVRGSSRDDVAVYLRESFELTDKDDELLEATLEEAVVRTREWRAVPNPIPRRKRLRGR